MRGRANEYGSLLLWKCQYRYKDTFRQVKMKKSKWLIYIYIDSERLE